jgi:hypothetical protein
MAIPPPPEDPRKLAATAAPAAPGAIPPPPGDPAALAGGGAPAASERGTVGKAWDALAVPEAKSREGLNAVARAVNRYFPGGDPSAPQAAPANELMGVPGLKPNKLVVDLAKGAPKALAESVAETAAKVAPPFVSRGSILTAGVLGGLKAASPVGRALARAAEGWSGLEYKNPGILKEAANDASLIFAPGKDKAGLIYEAATNRANVPAELKAAMTHPEMVKAGKEALDAGQLSPDGALVARQSLDAIKKTMPRGNYIELRDAFDKIAKGITAEADAAYARGLKADALRGVLPVNKGGGTSIAKSAIGALMGKMGLPLMSPIVQGATATAVGAATRNIPGLSAAAGVVPQATSALARRIQKNGGSK